MVSQIFETLGTTFKIYASFLLNLRKSVHLSNMGINCQTFETAGINFETSSQVFKLSKVSHYFEMGLKCQPFESSGTNFKTCVVSSPIRLFQ